MNTFWLHGLKPGVVRERKCNLSNLTVDSKSEVPWLGLSESLITSSADIESDHNSIFCSKEKKNESKEKKSRRRHRSMRQAIGSNHKKPTRMKRKTNSFYSKIRPHQVHKKRSRTSMDNGINIRKRHNYLNDDTSQESQADDQMCCLDLVKCSQRIVKSCEII